MAIAEGTSTVSHFIGGKDVPSVSRRTFATIDPSTGEEIGQVAFGEAEDVDHAVAAGQAAFESGVWSKASPGHRATVLRRLGDLIRVNADRIGAIESRDTGKPIAQATAEVNVGADFFTYFAGHAELPNGRTYPADAGYFVYSVREPYGVVGAISPWNFPFLLACWKTAPALAVGNSIVLKMAEQTPLSTAELGALTLERFIGRVDYLVCSGYKHLLSPRGTAYLYVRRDRWDGLEPSYANWRSADAPFGRYFGGPLTLAPDARRFDVSRAWFPWVGATTSLRLLAEWKGEGVLEAVRDLAGGLAARLGVPWYGSSLVCAPLVDGEAARSALAAAGIRASVRGTAIRFAVHVYNTEADLDRAAEVVAPFQGVRR